MRFQTFGERIKKPICYILFAEDSIFVPGAWEICSSLLGNMFQAPGKYVPAGWNDKTILS